MEKCDMLYEGKAKKVYATDDPELYIVDYKDDATAFNGLKKGTIAGKGAINNRVTNHLMKLLEKEGHPHALCRGALRPRDAGQKSDASFRWRSSSATSPPVPSPSASACRRARCCKCTVLEYLLQGRRRWATR